MRRIICMLMILIPITTLAAEREPVPVLSLDGYVMQEAGIATHRGGFSEGGPRTRFLDRSGWISALHAAEFCYVGRVDTLVADCITMLGGGIQYMALVRFEVMEPYWGVSSRYHVCEMHLINDDCIRYEILYPNALDIGDTCLVFGHLDKRDRIEIRDRQLLRCIDGTWIDNAGDPLATPDLFQMIQMIGIVGAKRLIPHSLSCAFRIVSQHDANVFRPVTTHAA